MGTEFMAALKAEIASLEQELERDVRFKRLRELRDVVLALYSDSLEPQTLGGSSLTSVTADLPRRRQGVRQPSPERERALAAAAAFVRSENRVVPTREILDHLVSRGMDVGGVSPLNNLSAMISTSGLFQAHGRRGWTIKREEDAAEPALGAADYDEIASEVFNELTDADMTHLESYVHDSPGLPQDIDSRLLKSARSRTEGVLLTEHQRVNLRNTFRRLVQTAAR